MYTYVTVYYTMFVCSLSQEDLQDGIIQLRYVRFQDVSSITASHLLVFSFYAVITLDHSRECTDLNTDSDSVPISVDRNRFRSNERSVTDLAVIRPVICFI